MAVVVAVIARPIQIGKRQTRLAEVDEPTALFPVPTTISTSGVRHGKIANRGARIRLEHVVDLRRRECCCFVVVR
jgi:hypothetical protein